MMKKFIFKPLLMAGVVLVMYSCGSSSDSSLATSETFPPHKVKRLDVEIYQYSAKNAEEQKAFQEEMASGISTVSTMLSMGHPDDSAFVKYIHSEAVKMFTPEVDKQFSNLEALENVLGGIKQNMEKVLPDVKMCEIYSIVSPYKQSIFIADSTMLVALNHYLGIDHNAYDGFDAYVKKTKQAKFIPYDIVEAMIGTYKPYVAEGEEVLLSKMLYAGAIVEAQMRLVPEASLALALGYDEEELSWLEKNFIYGCKAVAISVVKHNSSKSSSTRPCGKIFWI